MSMDGLPAIYTGPIAGLWNPSTVSVADGDIGQQRTLAASIGCVGIGLHCGGKVSLLLAPAAAGTGIVFHRSDLGIDIPARFDRVIDTRLCTVLGAEGEPQARVGTVEHLMAALAGAGVSNARITLDGPEVPILDGSAESFSFLIDCAGVVAQDAALPEIEVTRIVRVEQGEGFCELRPAPLGGLDLSVSIAFDAPAIGRQALSITFSGEEFRAEIARARTFTLAGEIAQLRAAGLALGGSLDNAVVVDGDRVVNPGGLRMPDEFVRHKLLDAVGDLALAGAAIRGRFVAHRGGHALNNRLLRALFADRANWRAVVPKGGASPSLPGWRGLDRQAAAAPV